MFQPQSKFLSIPTRRDREHHVDTLQSWQSWAEKLSFFTPSTNQPTPPSHTHLPSLRKSTFFIYIYKYIYIVLSNHPTRCWFGIIWYQIYHGSHFFTGGLDLVDLDPERWVQSFKPNHPNNSITASNYKLDDISEVGS